MRVADQCDVVVIGAGPAGSTAAQLLASWGWSVALIHREATTPSLAESLPASTRKLLAFLGQLTLVESYRAGWAWSVPLSPTRRQCTVMVDGGRGRSPALREPQGTPSERLGCESRGERLALQRTQAASPSLSSKEREPFRRAVR